jgi:hypothetical protein
MQSFKLKNLENFDNPQIEIQPQISSLEDETSPSRKRKSPFNAPLCTKRGRAEMASTPETTGLSDCASEPEEDTKRQKDEQDASADSSLRGNNFLTCDVVNTILTSIEPPGCTILAPQAFDFNANLKRDGTHFLLPLSLINKHCILAEIKLTSDGDSIWLYDSINPSWEGLIRKKLRNVRQRFPLASLEHKVGFVVYWNRISANYYIGLCKAK